MFMGIIPKLGAGALKPADAGMPERLALLLSPKLKQLGFKRRRLSWSVSGKDCTLVFNIQKSAYGPGAYLNAGLFLHRFHPDPSTRHLYYKSDLHFRISNLISNQRSELALLVRGLEQGESATDPACIRLCDGLMEVVSELMLLLDVNVLRLQAKRLSEFSLILPDARQMLLESP